MLIYMEVITATYLYIELFFLLLLFQSVNSGKQPVIRTLFLTIIHIGQIGLPQ